MTVTNHDLSTLTPEKALQVAIDLAVDAGEPIKLRRASQELDLLFQGISQQRMQGRYWVTYTGTYRGDPWTVIL